MTENNPLANPAFLEKLKQQTELLENAVESRVDLNPVTGVAKHRVLEQYRVVGTPYTKKVLNERQKREKTAKRKAVKAARRINR